MTKREGEPPNIMQIEDFACGELQNLGLKLGKCLCGLELELDLWVSVRAAPQSVRGQREGRRQPHEP